MDILPCFISETFQYISVKFDTGGSTLKVGYIKTNRSHWNLQL